MLGDVSGASGGVVAERERVFWPDTGLTLNMTERRIGGSIAATMQVEGCWVIVQVDPVLVRPAQLLLVRYWAVHAASSGWHFAALTARDMAGLTGAATT